MVQEPELTTEDLRSIYSARAAFELEAAAALLPGSSDGADGDPFSRSIVASAAPLDGRVLDAATKALVALGFGPVFTLVTRPVPGPDSAVAARVEMVVEAVDPVLVVALDAVAAADAAAAFGAAPPPADGSSRVRGRLLASVAGFADSLDDERAKRRAWNRFKAIAADSGETGTGRPW